MIRHRRLLSALGLVLLSAACAEPPDEDPETTARSAIEELRDAWVTHYNLHHPDMVADLYTDDAFVASGDMTLAEGRDEVEAMHRDAMEAAPTVQVGIEDVRLFQDQAVGWGPYSIDFTGPDGEPASVAGTYLSLLRRVDAEWRIAGRVANFDSPMPEGFQWADPGEAPTEASTMTAFIQEYETHWNLQHPDMVADLYADDAVVAFADSPVVRGRQALEQSIRQNMDQFPSTLDVHGVETIDLGPGWALDGGWYELASADDGEPVQWGVYMILLGETEDGEWRIHWHVNNGRPVGGM
jgi:uncharacterized protein (TIGR02246 family)